MGYNHYHCLWLLPIMAMATSHGAITDPAGEFLTAHNTARAAVGVAPLRWSERLASSSSRVVRYQRNNMGCQFGNMSGRAYGSNQQWAKGASITPKMAVEDWVKEKNFYRYEDNSCAPNHMCGVYTQVVWGKSVELGCAQALCVKDQITLTICLYSPPGNFVGEKPY